jgi:hypothetical protein
LVCADAAVLPDHSLRDTAAVLARLAFLSAALKRLRALPFKTPKLRYQEASSGAGLGLHWCATKLSTPQQAFTL